jgi:hypothetical protein
VVLCCGGGCALVWVESVLRCGCDRDRGWGRSIWFDIVWRGRCGIVISTRDPHITCLNGSEHDLELDCDRCACHVIWRRYKRGLR